uniref:Lysosomal trafficking regulator n=1 Tax=Molossus molossus TaxID=27622 RepID=A0A7J8BN81_MOLMO|nr:lysosomal trafficking regulator [Molossus molossus]
MDLQPSANGQVLLTGTPRTGKTLPFLLVMSQTTTELQMFTV